MRVQRGLLIIGVLWVMGGCGTTDHRPGVSAPGADQATAGPPAAIGIAPSATAAAADAQPPPTTIPHPSAEPAAAEAPPAVPETFPPSWIAVASSPDPVEGIGTIDLVNIHTGHTQAAVCAQTGPDLTVWSPDGRWLVCSFVFSGSQFKLIDSSALSHTIDLTIAPDRDHTQAPRLAWSPNSQRLAVSTGTAIVVFHLEDTVRTQELVQCANNRCSELAWSPDGQWLAYGRENGLALTSIDGTESPGASLGIRPQGSAPGGTAVEAIAWSPTADQIAYATAAGVFVMPISGDGTRQVADAAATAPGIEGLRWSPEGTSLDLATADGAVVRLAADGSSAPVETHRQGTGAAARHAMSADGQCSAELRQTGTTPIPWAEQQYDAPVYELVVRYGPHDGGVVLRDTIVSIEERIVVSPAEASTPALAWAEPAMRGCGVLELQARLQAGGYPTIAIDGVYGPETAAAVQDFQTAHALPRTGSVDPATWQVVRSLK